jgi:2-polyprenyl-6-methoxyphenol hydroxylase-like FAD-dependent oxidoreductase
VPDADIDVLETRPYRIHRRLASTYRKGRVFLAGDAAHLNSPSGGMGMNGGIHDAFSLVEKLVAVLQDGADERILDRYERQRRPIAEEEIIQQSHRNRTRMQERDPQRRREMLADLQRTIADPARLKSYLLKSSMIEGLRRAAATD